MSSKTNRHRADSKWTLWHHHWIPETTKEDHQIIPFCATKGNMDQHLTTNVLPQCKTSAIPQPTEPLPHPCGSQDSILSLFRPLAANKSPTILTCPQATQIIHNMVSHQQQFHYFGGQAFSKAMASQQNLLHGRLQPHQAPHTSLPTSQASGCVLNFAQRVCFVDHLVVNHVCLHMWTWHNPASGIVHHYAHLLQHS